MVCLFVEVLKVAVVMNIEEGIIVHDHFPKIENEAVRPSGKDIKGFTAIKGDYIWLRLLFMGQFYEFHLTRFLVIRIEECREDQWLPLCVYSDLFPVSV